MSKYEGHTPGPWRELVTRIDDSSGYQICHLDLHGKSERERDANRRLIAAAPELLSVVMAYVEHFEKHRITNTHGARDFDFTGHIAALARAAIAKATGEQA